MATAARSRRRRASTTTTTPERSFSEFGSAKQTTPGTKCPRCKTRDKAGNVGVRMNRKPEEGGNYKQVASRHIAFCEQCCIEVYEAIVGSIEAEAEGTE